MEEHREKNGPLDASANSFNSAGFDNKEIPLRGWGMAGYFDPIVEITLTRTSRKVRRLVEILVDLSRKRLNAGDLRIVRGAGSKP